jgi:uncharacterized protein (DUF305 family)
MLLTHLSFRAVTRLVRAAVVVTGLALVATQPARADGPAPTDTQQQAEVEYMQFVADHHLMGTLMAEMGQIKAERRRLEKLCARIERVQAREIGLVQRRLAGWYGIDNAPDITDADADDLDALGDFEGGEFDVELSRTFIDHHRDIIERSREVLPLLRHRTLRRLAEDIIRAQSREIRGFEAIIRSYGQEP